VSACGAPQQILPHEIRTSKPTPIALHNERRHPEVLAVFGEPRTMGHERLRQSFETPRKCAAPQDDGSVC
jgi:hypothetical protein